MRLILSAALALALTAPLARADEFTDTLESALTAYRAGDVKSASEDLAYASKVIGGQRSETLAKLLPAAPTGWTKTLEDSADAGVGMAIFGGGTTAAAKYVKDADEITVTLTADSPMVSSMGAMITGLSGMVGGKPLRIQRIEFAENDGELQGIVNDKVMVSVGGGGTLDQKKALIEAMDLKAMAEY